MKVIVHVEKKRAKKHYKDEVLIKLINSNSINLYKYCAFGLYHLFVDTEMHTFLLVSFSAAVLCCVSSASLFKTRFNRQSRPRLDCSL